jgi:hypothetical protein
MNWHAVSDISIFDVHKLPCTLYLYALFPIYFLKGLKLLSSKFFLSFRKHILFLSLQFFVGYSFTLEIELPPNSNITHSSSAFNFKISFTGTHKIKLFRSKVVNWKFGIPFSWNMMMRLCVINSITLEGVRDLQSSILLCECATFVRNFGLPLPRDTVSYPR